jgi:hypothetical protein
VQATAGKRVHCKTGRSLQTAVQCTRTLHQSLSSSFFRVLEGICLGFMGGGGTDTLLCLGFKCKCKCLIVNAKKKEKKSITFLGLAIGCLYNYLPFENCI